MGLSGMRERARSAGGTISFNTEAGFQIVCVLPREDRLGSISSR
jgi:signal transduction histidine kinase